MTINEFFENYRIDSNSLIILTRSDLYFAYMHNSDLIERSSIVEQDLNFAEMAAGDVKKGGIYHLLIKDLQVTEVVPFKDDCDDECYAIVVDISENQAAKIKKTITEQEYAYRNTNTMITI